MWYLREMAATVNVNGRVFDQEHAVVSVFDHGFLYGEGVYETMRTFNGEPFLFDRHMQRLRNSSGMLALPVPLSDEELLARCRETMRAAGLGTRARDRGLHPHAPDARRRRALLRSRRLPDSRRSIVIVKPQIDPPRRGLRARRDHRARADRAESSRIGEPADQVEQPAEQRAGDAGGGPARRVRRRHAELPRRTGRVHAVEPVRRQGRRRADAAARRGPAAGHHPRVPVRDRRRSRHSRPRGRSARRRPAGGGRGLPHQHDARCRAGDEGGRARDRQRDARPGDEGASERLHGESQGSRRSSRRQAGLPTTALRSPQSDA